MLVVLDIAGAFVVFAAGWTSSRALRPIRELVPAMPADDAVDPTQEGVA